MQANATGTFQTLFCNLLKARFPYLYIPTWEEERVLSVIRTAAQDMALIKTPRKVFTWSLTNGLDSDGQKGKDETKAALKALEYIEHYAEPAIFVLKDFHIYFGGNNRPPDPQMIRKVRDLVPAIKLSPKPKNVVFLSPSLVLPHELQKDITVVDFDLPTFAEIKSLLEGMIATNKRSGRIVIALTPADEERLAKAALGLTLQEAENAFARAMVEDGRLDARDVEVIIEEKRQVIKKTEVLEFIKSDLDMESVGGLENLKRWLKKRNNAWLDSAQRYGLPAPKGVLITGVPGCGKSLLAKAVSEMWQLPLLRLDVGRIFSGLVGSSEENMRTAIRTAEAIAPSILWIDEIEKGMGGTGAGGDSGTSARVFGTFLTWMQEKTRPVFVVATANNIHALPPELLRKGRFDEIFFVDLPTRKERMEILRLHMTKRLTNPQVAGTFAVTDDVLGVLADQSEGFIGAELEQVVISALFEAFSEDRAIALEDFNRAIRNTVPLSVTQAEQILSIREWANVRAVAATAHEDRAEYAMIERPEAPSPSSDNPEEGKDDIRNRRGGRTIDF